MPFWKKHVSPPLIGQEGGSDQATESQRPFKSEKHGFTIIHEPEGLLVADFVFVHGLTGDRDTTWTDLESGLMWPKDLLSEQLSGTRILAFGYDADIVNFWSAASQNRIRDHASNLISALVQLRERTRSTCRPIIFVVHSLGGLVVEDALLAARSSAETHISSLLDHIKGISFLGTPHAGSNIAEWANIPTHFTDLLKKTNKDLLRVLKPDSEVLARIQQEFHSLIRARGDQRLPPWKITCFFEELPTSGVGFIVPKHSAILPAYTHIGIYANHSNMSKFRSVNDPGFLAVTGELSRWVNEIFEANDLAQMEQAGDRWSSTPRSLAPNRQQTHLLLEGTSNTAGGGVFQGNNISQQGNSSYVVRF